MPNRILKESIRTSKSINALSDFQFRLWAYLITYVDDFGRGSAEPDIIKGFVFPRRKCVTETSIKTALTDLANMGLIQLYEVDGDSYLCLRNWEKHQKPRAATSKYPAPPEIVDDCEQMQADASRCSQMQADVPDTRYTILDNRYSNNDTRDAPVDTGGSARFVDFWQIYPNKVKKSSAVSAWKSGKCEKIADTIIADVQRRCDTEWKGQDIHFVPHPTTYLHQRRWEDETAPTERRDGASKEQPHNTALDYEQREYKAEDYGDDFFMFSPGWIKKHPEEAKSYGLTVEEG